MSGRGHTFRLAAGGRIDRRRPLHFRFDGREMAGFAGDTLASALLANGVHLVGRSFKYHRPRGILAAGVEEPNALVTTDHGPGRVTPNLRATEIVLHEGLVAISQNRWPSLDLDLGAANALLAPFLAAGFYYRTFMGPDLAGRNSAWRWLYEPLIRRMAGLGRPPSVPDPDRYAGRFAHCEVLVVGAGEAGLAAAVEASEDPGQRVLVCDEQAEPGGWLLTASGDPGPAGRAAAARLDSLLETLRRRVNVTLLARTQAFGIFAQGFVALEERLGDPFAATSACRPRARLWQVRAGRIVLATGAIERPLVFPDNDRPGIMLAGAVETYLHRYGVRPGDRAVILAACDSGYAAAEALHRGGTEVAAILDLRPGVDPALRARMEAKGIHVLPAATIIATEGARRVRAVVSGRIGAGGAVVPGPRIACDLVAMAGGYAPAIHLFSQARGALRWDPAVHGFVPAGAAPGQRIECRGACAGILPEAMVAPVHGALPVAGDPDRRKAFVDFQNDVTARDIRLATREGFVSVEHVKRYTTTGMATDQGKTANLNALAIVAGATGRSLPEAGLTTFRPPYAPVSFGVLAGTARGELFEPLRRTPIDPWACAAGAVFEPVGLWRRARFFPRAGEDEAAAVARECRHVRTHVGLFDASTLGKIELAGPDAAEFLERLYVNAVRNLAPGRCRYALMLDEAGFVIEDGIIARLAADRFHVTTTTGGAARVLTLFEDYRQTEWPELRAWPVSITEQWAVIAVQGPKAREVLAPLVEGLDLAPGAFPHMAVASCRVAGIAARLFRVSFTGELGFEVNVPAEEGRAVWKALHREAEKHGGAAYGTEAMHVLRAEKGYIIVGQETDGTVTPDDLGLGRLVGAGKGDFVGRRGLSRAALAAPGRRQLVGLRTEDPARVLEEGAQVVAMPDPAPGTPALGHVTSAYASAWLGHSIALALVADGRARLGTRVHVPMPGGAVAARIVPPVFIDPDGKRVHG
ncbi:2Fe-2S iron-sulfur cluster-binding protein [Rhabdaerophilum calidifontis]|uniref:2Fe-2S iron-sulfur cluster-binding protein n=1 Tax=Rhabdaerophilum calidifontis TaxID=2604328 RepID=UPI0012383F7A|nr:2Fe-2S iron-sulfur cluster-binding protein [Rhabdaerophilum calidifontis]